MNPPRSSLNASLEKRSFACIRCSERKVRCDKRDPCNACVRHQAQCIFRPTKPPRSKRELVKDELVDERLKRYEALLQENGIDPNQVIGASDAGHQRKSNRSEAPETDWKLSPQAPIFKPHILRGNRGTELVDNSLWSRVAEEIHTTEAALGEDSVNDASDGGTSNDDFAYVLGCKYPLTAPSHPPVELIHQLWQTFIENVNPLTKLVHVPSLQPAIEKAATNIEQVPSGFEALMFAIYSISVLSLTEVECKDKLGESRAILLPRYVAATKEALLREKFMSSTSIVILQALVLHILSIRDSYEPRAVWSLTGVAIRIAEGMGVCLDGTLLGLSPFETEIRRRIWWQLKMHDFRAAELSGQAKFRTFTLDETTPKKPANVNDTDLHPSMPQAAVESTRPTEMIWCMFRSELASFAATQMARMHKLGKAVFVSHDNAAMDDLQVKNVFIKELEDTLETMYLRFCDPSQPLQLMCLLGGRCAINIVRFMAHHPRRWANLDHVPASEQQLVWNIVVQLLEQYRMMQSSPQLRCFAWNVPYFIQWHAVIHVLDTLRANPLHQDAVKAWRLIDSLYENNSEMLLSLKRPVLVAVGSLCLKAFRARAVALMNDEKSVSDPPEYITKLQKQRESRERRETRITKNKGQETFDRRKRLTTISVDTISPGINPSSAKAQIEARTQRDSVAKQPEYLVQKTTDNGDDLFWVNEALGAGSFASGAADRMNLDTDAILAQDFWLDTRNDEAIDWAQWDAWLGNLDPTQSSVGAGYA